MIRGDTLSSVPPTSIFEVAGYFQTQSSKSSAGTPLNILNQKNIADCKTEGKAIKPLSMALSARGAVSARRFLNLLRMGGP